MRRNLISRVNMESDYIESGEASPEAAQEAVTDLVVADSEGSDIVSDAVQLECAFTTLDNITQLATNLEDAGVDPDIVAEQVAPVAIEAIAQVDEGVADETAEEATIALESDDKKSVWQTIKAKAIQIWEAIKANLKKFWKWVMETIFRRKSAEQKLAASLKDLIKEINAAPTYAETKMPGNSHWSLGGVTVGAAQVASSVKELSKMKQGFGNAGLMTMIERFKGAETANSVEEIKAVIDALIKKYVETNVSTTMAGNFFAEAALGYELKEGKLVTATIEKDKLGEVSTGSKAELLAIANSAYKCATVSEGLDASVKRLEKVIGILTAKIDKYITDKTMDEAKAKAVKELVATYQKQFPATIKQVKEAVSPISVVVAANAQSFVKAALAAGTKKAA